MIGLFVRKGPLVGTCFLLENEASQYFIGRDDSSQIRINMEGVSNSHARLWFKDGNWHVKDLESRNGIFVNGLPVEESMVVLKDVITVGPVEFQIVERASESITQDSKKEPSQTKTLTYSASQLLLGKSKVIQNVITNIRKVGEQDIAVLIQGETGTGKELTARAIHSSSKRKYHPFVPINCGAIPSELIESEFFGHEKGSFTGAVDEKAGHFEMASGGTLFLDEIGDLPLMAQTALLRVLETGKIRRVGGEEELSVDVRVLAATHKDLKKMVDEKTFREDLFHRLSVFEIYMPPLRERKEDLKIISEHILSTLTLAQGRGEYKISKEAYKSIEEYSWPGNIRELKNVLERAVILAEDHVIAPELLSLNNQQVRGVGSLSDLFPVDEDLPTLSDFENQMAVLLVEEAIKRSGGNKSQAAQLINISRNHLYEILKRK